MVGQHVGIVASKNVDEEKGGKYLDTNGRIGVYDGTVLKCEHGRQRPRCKGCGGSEICEHGMRRSVCKECKAGEVSKDVGSQWSRILCSL